MRCHFTFFTIVITVRSNISTEYSNIDTTRSFPGYSKMGVEYTTFDTE